MEFQEVVMNAEKQPKDDKAGENGRPLGAGERPWA